MADKYWDDTRNLTGLNPNNATIQWLNEYDETMRLVYPPVALDVDFPDDPPVGTQIFQFCDSYDTPATNSYHNGWKRDGAGRSYHWGDSPYVRAYEESN